MQGAHTQHTFPIILEDVVYSTVLPMIRTVTEASSEMLPNGMDQELMISGTNEAMTRCISHICSVMVKVRVAGVAAYA
jgi:hypothetical protein